MPEERSARSSRWWRPVLVAVGVASIASGTIWLASRADEPPSAPPSAPRADAQTTSAPRQAVTTHPNDSTHGDDTTSPLAELLVEPGDAVQANGVVIEGPDGLQLCETLPEPLIAYPPGQDPPPTCSSMAVRLFGVDGPDLPGWTVRDGVGFSRFPGVVQGTWSTEGILFDRVVADGSADEPSERDSWVVPCPPPAAGWGVDRGYTDLAVEEAEIAAVDAMIEHEPDRFHSLWIGYPDGDPFGPSALADEFGAPMITHMVLLVSTVEDPSIVQAELAEIYTGNLCVVRVERSLAELEEVVDRLATEDGSWRLDADGLDQSVQNRALLELPVLDAAAIERIGADAELLEVDPLVRPV